MPIYLIPRNLKESLDRYVTDAIEPGGFLRACLENNLVEAFGRADLENRDNLFYVVEYIYNELPSTCWGSEEKVAAWLGRGNLNA